MRVVSECGLSGIVAAAILALGCTKTDAQAGAAKAPSFEPSAVKTLHLSALGVTVSAPENLTVKKADGEVTLSAPGIADIVLRRTKNAQGNIGRMSVAGSSVVRSTIMAPEAVWTCEAKEPGAHQALISTLCKSMAPKENPHLVFIGCDTVVGLDPAAVSSALEKQGPAVATCFAKEAAARADYVGGTFSFSLAVKGASRSRSASNAFVDSDAKACGKAAGEALFSAPVFKPASGGFEAHCKAVWSAF